MLPLVSVSPVTGGDPGCVGLYVSYDGDGPIPSLLYLLEYSRARISVY